MTSPRNRAPLDRVGQRAAGRRRVTGATAWTAAGGAALAVAFGTVFAQGAAADIADQPKPAAPTPVADDWVAPAALRKAPAPVAPPTSKPAPAPTTAATKAAPKPVTKAQAPAPAPPAAPPAAAHDDDDDTGPAASTGGS